MSGRVCIFGEVLFDHFPDGRRVLGGAPFNVAWHLQAFGAAPLFISRIGDDAEGDRIRTAMADWGMDTGALQRDSGLPTGRVAVQFDDDEPSYDIVHPAAYDAIEAPAAANCGLIYHGSLALRDAASREALAALRAAAPGELFIDVNLRPPWWSKGTLLPLLHGADWIKLNADELDLLHAAGGDVEQRARSFLDNHQVGGLVLTRGAAGAEVFTATGGHHSAAPKRQAEVVDTVGAGDAFASIVILGLQHAWPLDLTLARAQEFASAIVGQRGATVADRAFYQPFSQAWQLDT